MGPAAKEQELRIFSGRGTDDAPMLAGSGVMQVLRCRLLDGKEVDVADHKVVLAEVLGILSQPRRAGTEQAIGLCYADRGYRTLGEPMRLEQPDPEEDTGEQILAQASEEDVKTQRTIGLNVRRGDEVS